MVSHFLTMTIWQKKFGDGHGQSFFDHDHGALKFADDQKKRWSLHSHAHTGVILFGISEST